MKSAVAMKTITTVCLLLFTLLAARAQLFFSDNFNYPNGLVETDGVWYCYSPTTPKLDAFVVNHQLILNESNSDSVAAPFTNTSITELYASFTINVSTLPTQKGGYFGIFMDPTNNAVNHIFIATTNTQVPGTYQLGIDNFAPYANEATYFPLDLATDTVYHVVVNWDETGLGATLWVNPSSMSDENVYGTDGTNSTYLQTMKPSRIAFSQYTGQGVAAIGNVLVGGTYGDVTPYPAQAPVFGIEPQPTNTYTGDVVTLYTAASGTGALSYQWCSNNVPLADSGTTVVGSHSNILTLAPQNTANYTVVISDATGSITSQVAAVTVVTTPTPPFFTVLPQGQTNAIGATITLTALALGTGPISYQWYWEPTNSVTYSQVGSGPTLTLPGVTFGSDGLYYVTATGADGHTNSTPVNVLVTPPPMVTIAYLHSLMTLDDSGSYNINGTSVYNVQGVVTTFGPISANGDAYGEFYMQDATAGIYVYVANQGSNAVPPPGALVSVTGPVTVYDGQLEMDPNVTTSSNNVTVLSYNNQIPAPLLANFSLEATNPLGTYGIQIQDQLVTFTNVYIYKNTTGGSVGTNTYYSGGYSKLYGFEGPYSATNTAYITLFIPAYGGLATNFWNQPEAPYAYQISGVMAYYDGAELDTTRLQDIVTSTPAPFTVGITQSAGTPIVTWPAAAGSTYSIYGATNILGPWTLQASGLGYWPCVGAYTDTNAAPIKFYRLSTP
jgi:hypothetical protein